MKKVLSYCPDIDLRDHVIDAGFRAAVSHFFAKDFEWSYLFDETPFRSFLIICETEAEILALRKGLHSFCSMRDRPFQSLYLSRPEHLESLMTSRSLKDGDVVLAPGSLPRVLVGGGVLLLDLGAPSVLVEEFNSLFLDPPFFRKYSAAPGTEEAFKISSDKLKIVGCCTLEQYQALTAAADSRYQVVLKSSSAMRAISERAPSSFFGDIEVGDEVVSVNLHYYGDPADFRWRDQLVGRFMLRGDQLVAEDGVLSEILERLKTESIPTLRLLNPPSDPLFDVFVDRLRLGDPFEFNGREFKPHVPIDVVLETPEMLPVVRENKYLLAYGNPELLDSVDIVVNASTFQDLFERYEIQDGKPVQIKGLLDPERPQNLFISTGLLEYQWYQLLIEYPQELSFLIPSHVKLPRFFTGSLDGVVDDAGDVLLLEPGDVASSLDRAIVTVESLDPLLALACLERSLEGPFTLFYGFKYCDTDVLSERWFRKDGTYSVTPHAVLYRLKHGETVVVVGGLKELYNEIDTLLLMGKFRNGEDLPGRLILIDEPASFEMHFVPTRSVLPVSHRVLTSELNLKFPFLEENPDLLSSYFMFLEHVSRVARGWELPPLDNSWALANRFFSLCQASESPGLSQVWQAVATDVLTGLYGVDPEKAAYLAVCAKLAFPDKSEGAGRIHVEKLRALLDTCRTQADLDSRFWQMASVFQSWQLNQLWRDRRLPEFDLPSRAFKAAVFKAIGVAISVHYPRFKKTAFRLLGLSGVVRVPFDMSFDTRPFDPDKDQVTRVCTQLRDQFSVVLYGVPGAGKTYLAQEVAKRLGLRYIEPYVVGLQTNPTELIGTVDVSRETGDFSFKPGYVIHWLDIPFSQVIADADWTAFQAWTMLYFSESSGDRWLNQRLMDLKCLSSDYQFKNPNDILAGPLFSEKECAQLGPDLVARITDVVVLVSKSVLKGEGPGAMLHLDEVLNTPNGLDFLKGLFGTRLVSPSLFSKIDCSGTDWTPETIFEALKERGVINERGFIVNDGFLNGASLGVEGIDEPVRLALETCCPFLYINGQIIRVRRANRLYLTTNPIGDVGRYHSRFLTENVSFIPFYPMSIPRVSTLLETYLADLPEADRGVILETVLACDETFKKLLPQFPFSIRDLLTVVQLTLEPLLSNPDTKTGSLRELVLESAYLTLALQLDDAKQTVFSRWALTQFGIDIKKILWEKVLAEEGVLKSVIEKIKRNSDSLGLTETFVFHPVLRLMLYVVTRFESLRVSKLGDGVLAKAPFNQSGKVLVQFLAKPALGKDRILQLFYHDTVPFETVNLGTDLDFVRSSIESAMESGHPVDVAEFNLFPTTTLEKTLNAAHLYPGFLAWLTANKFTTREATSPAFDSRSVIFNIPALDPQTFKQVLTEQLSFLPEQNVKLLAKVVLGIYRYAVKKDLGKEPTIRHVLSLAKRLKEEALSLPDGTGFSQSQLMEIVAEIFGRFVEVDPEFSFELEDDVSSETDILTALLPLCQVSSAEKICFSHLDAQHVAFRGDQLLIGSHLKPHPEFAILLAKAQQTHRTPLLSSRNRDWGLVLEECRIRAWMKGAYPHFKTVLEGLPYALFLPHFGRGFEPGSNWIERLDFSRLSPKEWTFLWLISKLEDQEAEFNRYYRTRFLPPIFTEDTLSYFEGVISRFKSFFTDLQSETPTGYLEIETQNGEFSRLFNSLFACLDRYPLLATCIPHPEPESTVRDAEHVEASAVEAHADRPGGASEESRLVRRQVPRSDESVPFVEAMGGAPPMTLAEAEENEIAHVEDDIPEPPEGRYLYSLLGVSILIFQLVMLIRFIFDSNDSPSPSGPIIVPSSAPLPSPYPSVSPFPTPSAHPTPGPGYSPFPRPTSAPGGGGGSGGSAGGVPPFLDSPGSVLTLLGVLVLLGISAPNIYFRCRYLPRLTQSRVPRTVRFDPETDGRVMPSRCTSLAQIRSGQFRGPLIYSVPRIAATLPAARLAVALTPRYLGEALCSRTVYPVAFAAELRSPLLMGPQFEDLIYGVEDVGGELLGSSPRSLFFSSRIIPVTDAEATVSLPVKSIAEFNTLGEEGVPQFLGKAAHFTIGEKVMDVRLENPIVLYEKRSSIAYSVYHTQYMYMVQLPVKPLTMPHGFSFSSPHLNIWRGLLTDGIQIQCIKGQWFLIFHSFIEPSHFVVPEDIQYGLYYYQERPAVSVATSVHLLRQEVMPIRWDLHPKLHKEISELSLKRYENLEDVYRDIKTLKKWIEKQFFINFEPDYARRLIDDFEGRRHWVNSVLARFHEGGSTHEAALIFFAALKTIQHHTSFLPLKRLAVSFLYTLPNIVEDAEIVRSQKDLRWGTVVVKNSEASSAWRQYVFSPYVFKQGGFNSALGINISESEPLFRHSDRAIAVYPLFSGTQQDVYQALLAKKWETFQRTGDEPRVKALFSGLNEEGFPIHERIMDHLSPDSVSETKTIKKGFNILFYSAGEGYYIYSIPLPCKPGFRPSNPTLNRIEIEDDNLHGFSKLESFAGCWYLVTSSYRAPEAFIESVESITFTTHSYRGIGLSISEQTQAAMRHIKWELWPELDVLIRDILDRRISDLEDAVVACKEVETFISGHYPLTITEKNEKALRASINRGHHWINTLLTRHGIGGGSTEANLILYAALLQLADSSGWSERGFFPFYEVVDQFQEGRRRLEMSQIRVFTPGKLSTSALVLDATPKLPSLDTYLFLLRKPAAPLCDYRGEEYAPVKTGKVIREVREGYGFPDMKHPGHLREFWFPKVKWDLGSSRTRVLEALQSVLVEHGWLVEKVTQRFSVVPIWDARGRLNPAKVATREFETARDLFEIHQEYTYKTIVLSDVLFTEGFLELLKLFSDEKVCVTSESQPGPLLLMELFLEAISMFLKEKVIRKPLLYYFDSVDSVLRPLNSISEYLAIWSAGRHLYLDDESQEWVLENLPELSRESTLFVDISIFWAALWDFVNMVKEGDDVDLSIIPKLVHKPTISRWKDSTDLGTISDLSGEAVSTQFIGLLDKERISIERCHNFSIHLNVEDQPIRYLDLSYVSGNIQIYIKGRIPTFSIMLNESKALSQLTIHSELPYISLFAYWDKLDIPMSVKGNVHLNVVSTSPVLDLRPFKTLSGLKLYPSDPSIKTLYLPDLRRIDSTQLKLLPQLGLERVYVSHKGDADRVFEAFSDVAWHGCEIIVLPPTDAEEDEVRFGLADLPSLMALLDIS